jgi:TM2 domain-containing membrane protein YozV
MTVKRHCWHCGTQIDANQAVCINCGASLAGVAVTPKSDKRVLAGVMGILFGAFGVHKFILGYTTEGLIMLLVTVLTLGIGGIVMAIIGIIEGITYLTKSDAEFQSTYVVGKKGWF